MPRALSPYALLIPLAGLATFLAVYYVFTVFGNQTIGGIAPVAADTAAYTEARIRLQWLAATVAFSFVAAVAIASLMIDVFATTRAADGRRHWRYDDRLRIGATAGFLAGCALVFVVVFADDDRMYLYLGEDLFRAVFAICGDLAGCFGQRGAQASYDGLLKYGVAVAAAGVVACAIGSAMSLARAPGGRHGAAEIAHARYYLYLSSALLSFGILGMMAWMRLPEAVIADADARALYSDHVKAVVLYWGVAFSVVILSYNLPTMMALRLHGAEAAPKTKGAAPAPDAAPDARAGTIVSLREVVTASIAFLTPALLPLSVELGSNLMSLVGGAGGG